MDEDLLLPTPGFIEPDTQPLGDEAFAANSSSDDEGSHHSPAVVQQVGGDGGGGGRVRKRLLDDGTAAKTSPASRWASAEGCASSGAGRFTAALARSTTSSAPSP